MKKTFDCVEMKRQIQAKLLKERRDLGEEEFRRRTRARILAHPVLGHLWRDLPRSPRTPSTVKQAT